MAVDGVVTGIVSFKGRSAENLGERIPMLIKILETEQDELKQFDAGLEKTSLL